MDTKGEYTEEEQRKLLGKLIEILVKFVMGNHLYKFEGKIRRQKHGCGIGHRLAQKLGKVAMNKWMKRYAELGIENELRVDMMKKYVDDVDLLMEVIRRGMRWCTKENKMRWTQEWKREDDEKNEEDDARTMREMAAMANSICKYLKFKEDYPSKNEGGKMPILDIKM